MLITLAVNCECVCVRLSLRTFTSPQTQCNSMSSSNQKSNELYIYTIPSFLCRTVPCTRISALSAVLSLHIMQSHIGKFSQTLGGGYMHGGCYCTVSGNHIFFWQLPIPGCLQSYASTYLYKLHRLCVCGDGDRMKEEKSLISC